VSLASHKEKKNSWQCDGLVWSVHGRYVFAAFSGKLSDDKNHSVIKVWDSLTRETIHDLARGNNIKLIGFTFLLAPHPKLENIIMTGSDGGTICLWNVQTR
jgi:WD40 repeat protein